MLRNTDCVHADETHWREDGKNAYVFYAGGEDVAVFYRSQHLNFILSLSVKSHSRGSRRAGGKG